MSCSVMFKTLNVRVGQWQLMALLVLILFKFWSSETPAGHLILTAKCLFILEILCSTGVMY